MECLEDIQNQKGIYFLSLLIDVGQQLLSAVSEKGFETQNGFLASDKGRRAMQIDFL